MIYIIFMVIILNNLFHFGICPCNYKNYNFFHLDLIFFLFSLSKFIYT